MPDMVEFKNVSLGYGRRTVLAGINLRVCAGERLGIVGPNGSGKTTLLRALLGSIKPRKGSVRWPGSGGRIPIGYVPQRQQMDEMFPLRVIEIVLMGRYRELGLFSRPGKEDYAAALDALETVGAADLADELYRHLSGGQKQRCLIARALAANPGLLVLDEPTADMDIAGEKRIMDLIAALHSERKLAVIMVSHVLNVILNYVDRIAVVREGTVRAFGLDQLLNERVLKEVYGVDLTVCEVNGRRVVMPGN